jgi:DNA-binding CsgD family transcriptional regulator
VAAPAGLGRGWPHSARRRGRASTGGHNLNLNRGLLGYADAVLAGRAGNPSLATQLARDADRSFVNCEVWADLARLLAADSALVAEWGEPHRWLEHVAATFRQRGLTSSAQRCHDLLGDPDRTSGQPSGVTRREAEVLSLLATGRPNNEIAGRLGVSARTVERYVEALLRKTATRSRTQLAVLARTSAEAPDRISPNA